MISCHEAKQFISQKLDGELNELETELLEEHLSACSECKIYEEELFSLHENLFKLQNIELTESIVDKLFDENNELTKKRNAKKSKKHNFRPWHGIVAAALLIGIAIPMLNSGNEENMYSLDQGVENSQIEIAEALDGRSTEYTANKESADFLVDNDIYGEGAADDNEMGILGIEATAGDLYLIEEVENQLLIYKEDSLIYKTRKWDQNFTVQWEVVNENEIIYSLYDTNNKLVEKNRIIPLEKKEEKIKE